MRTLKRFYYRIVRLLCKDINSTYLNKKYPIEQYPVGYKFSKGDKDYMRITPKKWLQTNKNQARLKF